MRVEIDVDEELHAAALKRAEDTGATVAEVIAGWASLGQRAESNPSAAIPSVDLIDAIDDMFD